MLNKLKIILIISASLLFLYSKEVADYFYPDEYDPNGYFLQIKLILISFLLILKTVSITRIKSIRFFSSIFTGWIISDLILFILSNDSDDIHKRNLSDIITIILTIIFAYINYNSIDWVLKLMKKWKMINQ